MAEKLVGGKGEEEKVQGERRVSWRKGFVFRN